MRRLLALAAALCALPATAGAATWTAPQTVSAPHTFAGPLLPATTFDGSTALAWRWETDRGSERLPGASFALRPAGGAFGPEQRIEENTIAFAPFARTQTLALALHDTGTPGPTGAQLEGIDATFNAGAPRRLVTAPTVGLPQLATSGATALVTWIEVSRTSTGAIRRIVRAIDRRDGGWGKPYTLSGRGRSDTQSAAAGANGDQVVAFVREGKLLVRVRRHGHGWGAIRTLATATGPTQWLLGTAINARGQVRVVWRRHELRVRTALESSALLVGRSSFTAAQTLVANGASSFHLTETPQGWAVADVEGNQPVLHRTDGGSRFLTGQAAAPAQGGTRGADVVFSPVGGLTVAWVQPLPDQDSDGVARAASFANGAWSAVEDVSPPEAVHEVRLTADGRSGQPVALWTARPGGTGPGVPIAQIASLVRSAARLP